jgi:hypothetical protein
VFRVWWILGLLMVSLLDVAVSHQLARERLSHEATVKALRLWRRMSVAELDASWDVVAPQLLQLVTGAQVVAASQAGPYLSRVASVTNGVPDTATVVPEAFGGVMLDGRELAPAMFGAVTTAKQQIAKGAGLSAAFQSGASYLSVIVKAAVADAGRQADRTTAVGRRYVTMVRVISPGACSRCAILAGSTRFSKPFLRHPACKCTELPLHEGESAPEGRFDSPQKYFDSLSKPEQDRVFTKAGAEAVRLGADPVSVVNARRGAYGIGYSGHKNAPGVTINRLRPVTIGRKADGSLLQVWATTEGTTARGAFAKSEGQAALTAGKDGRYRRTTTVRLMPEQIISMAGNNPVRARELLIRYGYLNG